MIGMRDGQTNERTKKRTIRSENCPSV